jgi:hypothetical protein
MAVTFIPDPQQDNTPSGDGYNKHLYADAVQPGSIWDTTYEFRRAAAAAKDTARNQLRHAIKLEEQRLLEQQLTTLSGSYLTSDPFSSDFSGQARSNVMVTRSIDGVEGAPDNAIKL